MIKTRFAPSPTGYLHIGGLRTALYAFLFAKQNNGHFILRIEDTDRTRLVEGSLEQLIGILEEFSLIPDEGPNVKSEISYIQSERLPIYKKYADKLIEEGKAYYCFCSSERLDELRKEQESLGLPTKYDGKCKYLTKEEIDEKLKNSESHTIRLNVPKNQKIVFEDLSRGKIEINSNDIDDQVLMKSDGFPTYHLAVVVDDHLMGITHIIRGDEWIPSTPKHILLYEMFDWGKPQICHLPVLVGKDGKKLSKRFGDVSVESFLAKGYPKEAIINYISLLGWNPKTTEEFFTLEELISRFKLENIGKSSAFFDIERLDFFASKYISGYNSEELLEKISTFLEKYDKEFFEIWNKKEKSYNEKVSKELQTRITKFSDFKTFAEFLYKEELSEFDENLFVNPKMKIETIEFAKENIKKAIQIIEKIEDFENIESIKNTFVTEIKNLEMKNGQILWPVRVALSGQEFSPGAIELIYIYGKEKSLRLLENIIN